MIFISLAILLFVLTIKAKNRVFQATYGVLCVLTMALGTLIFSGVAAPKRMLTVPVNKDQLEYDTSKDVDIITPPPRTENLNGFKPLKE